MFFDAKLSFKTLTLGHQLHMHEIQYIVMNWTWRACDALKWLCLAIYTSLVCCSWWWEGRQCRDRRPRGSSLGFLYVCLDHIQSYLTLGFLNKDILQNHLGKISWDTCCSEKVHFCIDSEESSSDSLEYWSQVFNSEAKVWKTEIFSSH